MGLIKILSRFIGGKFEFNRRMKEDTSPDKALIVETDDILNEKIVVFSDHHRGDGGNKDHFKSNEDIYCRALKEYYNNGFKLVLNGDVDEGWGYGENLQEIMESHKEKALKSENMFHADNRLYRIYGNHDDCWLDQKKVDKFLKPYMGNKEIKVYPAVYFKDDKYTLLVIHGCQGHSLHDVSDIIAKWGVRTNYGTYYEDPPVIYHGKDLDYQNELRRQEIYLLEWTMRKRLVMIGGHSHLPYFKSFPDFYRQDNELKKYLNSTSSTELGKKVIEEYLVSIKKYDRKPLKKKYKKLIENPLPLYFNCGCCTGFEEISAVEVDAGEIRLVEWNSRDKVIHHSATLNGIFKFI